MTDADEIMHPHNFLDRIRQTSGSGLIQQSGLESRMAFSWSFGVGGGLHSPSAVVITSTVFPVNKDEYSLHRCGALCRHHCNNSLTLTRYFKWQLKFVLFERACFQITNPAVFLHFVLFTELFIIFILLLLTTVNYWSLFVLGRKIICVHVALPAPCEYLSEYTSRGKPKIPPAEAYEKKKTLCLSGLFYDWLIDWQGMV